MSESNRICLVHGALRCPDCLEIMYLNEEIERLKSATDPYYLTSIDNLRGEIEKLRAESEKLNSIFERGNEIKNNWENKEYQEAAHYNWLDDENRRVEHDNFNLKHELEKYKAAFLIMKEANEFYINIENWQDNDMSGYPPSIRCDSLDGKDYDLMINDERFSKHITVGGKRAREASKRAAEIMGGGDE